jgi:hypothetical protein
VITVNRLTNQLINQLLIQLKEKTMAIRTPHVVSWGPGGGFGAMDKPGWLVRDELADRNDEQDYERSLSTRPLDLAEKQFNAQKDIAFQSLRAQRNMAENDRLFEQQESAKDRELLTAAMARKSVNDQSNRVVNLMNAVNNAGQGSYRYWN